MTKIFFTFIPGLILVKYLEGIPYILIARDLALILGWLVLFLFILGLIIGVVGGWFLASKRKLALFKLEKKSRILFFTPHPDDEILAAGGLLADFLKRKIPLKVVFLTNGDGNASLFFKDKKFRFSPQKFINTGEKRQQEAYQAFEKLGGQKRNLIFLGYPDGCLWSMWRDFKKKIISKTTQLDHSPYRIAFSLNTEYKGINLENDLLKIIKDFKPTVIFVPHLKEAHPDHRASFLFVKRVRKKLNWQGKIYQYLVHYKVFKFFRVYPARRKFNEGLKIIYPPYSLLGKGEWFSFWLSPWQLAKKKKALKSYQSQLIVPSLKLLFRSFLAQNEIFYLSSS